MKPTNSILFLTLCLSFGASSCSDSSSDNFVWNTVEQSTTSSNKLIESNIQAVLHELYQKKEKPETIDKAEFWGKKAVAFQSASNDLIKYLQRLIYDPSKFESTEFKAQTELFKKHFLEVDSSFLDAVPNAQPAFFKGADLNLFTDMPLLQQKIFLLQLVNQIRVLEFRAISFCNDQVYSQRGHYFDAYSAIIGQSSSKVGPGDTIEIIAGIGAFSRAAQPKIMVGDKIVVLNESAHADYKFKVQQRPGRYTVPVKIEFRNEEGEKIFLKREIIYQVE